MKKTALRALLACSLLLGSVHAFAAVSADAFNKGEINGNYETTDWMKHIPGSTYVCHVTIPGSHDTATGEGFKIASNASSAQTQEKSIVDQINAGIRGLDFRPNKNLECCHGIAVTKKSFESAIDDLHAFLKEHPTEFFIIHLLTTDNNDNYRNAIREFLKKDKYAGLFAQFRRDLTVDDMRGKILILNRNEESLPYGGELIYWTEQCWEGDHFKGDQHIKSRVQVGEGCARYLSQDVANTVKDADRSTKLDQLNRLAEYSMGTNPHYPDECEWFFNFGSAYNKTILGISQSTGYASNASDTNPTFINIVRSEKKGNLGIVLCDWVGVEDAKNSHTMGQSLIYALIENNFRYIDWVEDGRMNAFSREMYPMYADLGDFPAWNPIADNSVFLAKEHCSAIMADFDGNDWLDIYNVGDLTESNLYLNQGQGKEWLRVVDQDGNGKSDITPMNYPHLVTLDYNNDGLVDILAMGIVKPEDLSNYNSNNCKKLNGSDKYTALLLFKNQGEGRFVLEANFNIPTYYTRIGDNTGESSLMHPIAVGDFDRDGYVDIAISGLRIDADDAGGVQESALYRNQRGSGSFEKFDAGFKKTGGSAYMADFNNDGYLDIIFTGWGEGDMFGNQNGALYLNNNGLSFTDATPSDMHFTRHGADGIADFNNDGYLDFLTIGWSDLRWGYKSLLFTNSRTDQPFDLYQDINNYCGHLESRENFKFYLGDYNGDGHIDIMYDGHKDDSVDLGTSPTSFEGKYTPFPVRGHSGGNNACIALGDVTGNGLADRFQSGWNWFSEEYRQQLLGSDKDWGWDHTIWFNSENKIIAAPESPSNVFAVYGDGIITVSWSDVKDNSLAYNVVIVNETEGTVIANIPVNPATGKLRVAQGKEVCVRPGVQTYSIPVGDDIDITEFKAGVQAVSLANESASAINWAPAFPDPNAPVANEAAIWEYNQNGISVFEPVENSASIMADFTGNGHLDIYNAGQGGSPLYGNQPQSNLYVNNGDGTWSANKIENNEATSGIAPLRNPHFATLDFDNDGMVDILVAGFTNDEDKTNHLYPAYAINNGNGQKAATLLYHNNGDGSFDLVENTGLPTVFYNKTNNNALLTSSDMEIFAVGDFDHDGYADIAISARAISADNTEGNDITALYLGNGNGTFELAETPMRVTTEGNIHAADINNDGWLDLITDGWVSDPADGVNEGGSGARFYINDHNGGFIDATPANVYGVRDAGSAIADFNGDGLLDYVAIGYGDHGIGWNSLIFFNNGTDKPFTNYNSFNNLGLNGDQTLSLVARDFNGDGFIDIMYDGKQDNRVFYGQPDGSFKAADSHPVRGANIHNAISAVGDVTGNGFADRYQTGWHWVADDYRQPLFGSDTDWNIEHTLWENKTEKASAPGQPLDVNIAVDGDMVTLSWTDLPDLNVAYNVMLTTPDGRILSVLPADPETGKLRVAKNKHTAVRPGVGSYTFQVKPAETTMFHEGGIYTGAVQAVSLANETASPMAIVKISEDGTTSVGNISDQETFTIETLGKTITARASLATQVEIFDLAGRKVAEGVTNAPINVAKTGVYIVRSGNNNAKISIR